MLQTYKKAEEYIARSKTGQFMLMPYIPVKQYDENRISFGAVLIHKDDTVTLEHVGYYDETSLIYLGINAIPFTQKLKSVMVGVLPVQFEPLFATIHQGKMYPITRNSVFKYGVLQNPEPFKTIPMSEYKRVSKEVRDEIQTAFSMAMLISEDEIRKSSLYDESLAYALGHDIRVVGSDPVTVKKRHRQRLMSEKLATIPFTETINYEV